MSEAGSTTDASATASSGSTTKLNVGAKEFVPKFAIPEAAPPADTSAGAGGGSAGGQRNHRGSGGKNRNHHNNHGHNNVNNNYMQQQQFNSMMYPGGMFMQNPGMHAPGMQPQFYNAPPEQFMLYQQLAMQNMSGAPYMMGAHGGFLPPGQMPGQPAFMVGPDGMPIPYPMMHGGGMMPPNMVPQTDYQTSNTEVDQNVDGADDAPAEITASVEVTDSPLAGELEEISEDEPKTEGTATAADASSTFEVEETQTEVKEEDTKVASNEDSGILVYSKRQLLDLALPLSTPIPQEMIDFYSEADFKSGQENGEKFARAPLGFLSESSRVQALLSRPGTSSHSRGDPRDRSNSDRRGGGYDRNDNGKNNYRGGGNSNGFSRNRDNSSRDFARAREKADDEFFNNLDRNNMPKDMPEYKSMFKQSESDEDSVKRKTNFVLNRMSVTNFDRISDELIELLKENCSKDEKLLRKAVETIILKAQMEETFCFLYADLCRKIIDVWTEIETEDSNFSSVVETDADGVTTGDAAGEGEGADAKGEKRSMGKIFKEYLLSRCQTEFEFDRVAALDGIRSDEALQEDERLEREILLKKRITGHMRFIGEIYMKDLVKANIMKEHCLDILIECSEEEELVCMCKLFQTIGAKIEQYFYSRSRQKKNVGKDLEKIVPNYFDRILDISKNHPVSRIRFMMRDLYDMWKNNWQKRFEEEEMVNLEETRSNAAGSISRQNSPAPPASSPVPSAPSIDEDWSVVTTSRKKGNFSSTNLAAMGGGNLSRNNSVSSGLNRGSSSNNFGAMDSGKRGKNSGSNNSSSNNGRRQGGGVSKSSSKNNLAGGAIQRSNTPQPTSSGGGDSKGKGRGGNSKGGDTGSFVDSSRAPPARPATAPLPASPSKWSDSRPVEADAAKVAKNVKSTLDELYSIRVLKEAVECFEDLNPDPSLMPTVVKDMINAGLERSKEEDLSLLCDLLQELTRTQPEPILPLTALESGINLFLDELDDLLIDVPKAGTLGAFALAVLCERGVMSLQLFRDIPEENMFALSPKRAEFTMEILRQVQILTNAQRAEEMLKQSEIDLLAIIIPPPKQSAEETLASLAKKMNLLFLQ